MIRSPLLRAAALAVALGAPGAAALVSTPAAAQAQQRDAGAEAFVQREASRAILILRGASGPQERAEFRDFVSQNADVPRITQFVLGKYARSLPPAQAQAFAEAFRDYANGVYESRLSEYHGESLRVTGSTVRRPGDVVVTSQVVGGRQSQPVTVAWRVIGGGDAWKVVDVNVAGVWLAITERQDFTSTLDNNRGDVNVLIAQLRRQTAGAAAR